LQLLKELICHHEFDISEASLVRYGILENRADCLLADDPGIATAIEYRMQARKDIYELVYVLPTFFH